MGDPPKVVEFNDDVVNGVRTGVLATTMLLAAFLSVRYGRSFEQVLEELDMPGAFNTKQRRADAEVAAKNLCKAAGVPLCTMN